VEVVGPTLSLRYATPSDVDALFALASDPEVTRFFSWGPYRDRSEPLAYVERLAGERERGEQLDLLVVHHEDGPIGVTGLSELSRRDRRAVVGTWLGRRWWGSGANRESKALVARLGFERLGLDRIGAYADVENGRSQTALERVGFVREGVLRGWHRHGEDVHDVVIFSLLRSEFPRSPLAQLPARVEGEPPPAFVVAPPSSPEGEGAAPGVSCGAPPS